MSARLTLAHIEEAQDRAQQAGALRGPFLRQTPLWRLPGSSLGLACAEVWLKLEHLQVSGSFKGRGMLNRLLAQPLPDAGVVIASGGNAGIAAAAAARYLGARCEVFVPEVSSPAKRERLRALGATVVVQGAAYADALAACLLRQSASGALLAHAYDQPEVIAGAGTLALEMQAQAGGHRPDAVLVSVGGGGLIGGIASAWGDTVNVVALEPHAAPSLWAARQAGQPVDVAVGGIAADALGARRVGDWAWAITQARVREALLLSDESIVAAQRWLWRELRLVVEPAASLGLAALQSGTWQPKPSDTVALILCGGNVDPATLV